MSTMPIRSSRHRRTAAATLLTLSSLAACGEARLGDAEGRGTVIIATAADADFLLPTVVHTLIGKQAVDLVFDYLAEPPSTLNTVGDAGFAPRLARRWSWAPDSLSIVFELDPAARWHDGRPVRASDVRFSLAVMKDPKTASPHAPSVMDVDSISVRDSLTAVAWFGRRSPEQFFALVFNLAIVPEHLLADVERDKLRQSDFAQRPVGSGRFRFARWEKGGVIELVADTANYRGRPSIDRVMWSVTPDPTTLWVRVANEEADIVEVVRGEALEKIAASQTARLMPYPGFDYGFIVMNLRGAGRPREAHPLFSDADVRRAMSMAIDRRAVVRNIVDTLGYLGLGPVVRAQASADTTIPMLPFAPDSARAILEAAGWRDTNGDGIREKGGRALEFSLTVPSSSAIRRQIAVLVQAQWKDVGARVTIAEMEMNTFVGRLTSGQFDAAVNAFHTEPSPSVARQTWGGNSMPENGGANHGGYRSAVFDAYLDSATAAFDPVQSKAYYRKAYERIIQDAPAIWIYEPRMAAGISKRIEVKGGRADAWWTGLPEWTIPPDRRIARDRVPLVAPGAAAGSD